jgi:hypothetical protein
MALYPLAAPKVSCRGGATFVQLGKAMSTINRKEWRADLAKIGVKDILLVLAIDCCSRLKRLGGVT